MDSLPSIHRNGQRRRAPPQRQATTNTQGPSLVARNGTKVATFFHYSRSDASERYWSEQMGARISTLGIFSPNSRTKLLCFSRDAARSDRRTRDLKEAVKFPGTEGMKRKKWMMKKKKPRSLQQMGERRGFVRAFGGDLRDEGGGAGR